MEIIIDKESNETEIRFENKYNIYMTMERCRYITLWINEYKVIDRNILDRIKDKLNICIDHTTIIKDNIDSSILDDIIKCVRECDIKKILIRDEYQGGTMLMCVEHMYNEDVDVFAYICCRSCFTTVCGCERAERECVCKTIYMQ